MTEKERLAQLSDREIQERILFNLTTIKRKVSTIEAILIIVVVLSVLAAVVGYNS